MNCEMCLCQEASTHLNTHVQGKFAKIKTCISTLHTICIFATPSGNTFHASVFAGAASACAICARRVWNAKNLTALNLNFLSPESGNKKTSQIHINDQWMGFTICLHLTHQRNNIEERICRLNFKLLCLQAPYINRTKPTKAAHADFE